MCNDATRSTRLSVCWSITSFARERMLPVRTQNWLAPELTWPAQDNKRKSAELHWPTFSDYRIRRWKFERAFSWGHLPTDLPWPRHSPTIRSRRCSTRGWKKPRRRSMSWTVPIIRSSIFNRRCTDAAAVGTLRANSREELQAWARTVRTGRLA